MGYISAQQAATKWGISKRRVQVLCTENRIKDATRIGNMWVVPEDALKPADGRVQAHHTIESPTARVARTALKKLAVNAYQTINGKLNNPSTSKMVFVSLLATTIFCDIQSDESSNEKDDVFLMISSELLGNDFKETNQRSFWEMFSYMIADFEKYIYRYADYVDDILSWAYQYVNKLSLDSGLESTQFFTEEYMIKYLTKDIPKTATATSVYLDPACGGGNFLSHILNQLFVLRYRELDNPIACIENIFNALYGYELDPNLAAVASVNLKLKALMLLAKVRQVSTVDWRLFCPNIFTSVEPNGFGFLEADFTTHRIRRVADGKRENLESMTAVATEIYTNPPFQTVKGMASSMKEHLKKHFPNAKCDLCNAFILQCTDKIQTGGMIGLVTQSSWMYLDSFENLRRELITNNTIESIADLGSGAFYDLSGEKANVALVRVSKTPYANACVKVLTLRDISLKEKAAVLGKASDSVLLMQQTQLFGGEHMAFSLSQTTPDTMHAMPGKYGDHYLKLGHIFERITGIIDSYLPDEMAIEAPFFGKNVQSMLKLGRAQGVAMAAAIQRQVPITEYAPMKIKMAITGIGTASKEQVADMLRRMMHLDKEELGKFLDATDALAAAYCHYLQMGRPESDKKYSSWKDFVNKNKDRQTFKTTDARIG